MATLLLFLAVLIAITYFFTTTKQADAFDTLLLRTYLSDSATVIAKRGSLSTAATSGDTSGIMEVMQAIPSSICMDITAYDLSSKDGLVAYWKMDEGGSTAVPDHSGKGNLARIVSEGVGGLSLGEDGVSRKALRLNYSPSNYGYLIVPSSSSIVPSTGITIAAWVKTQGTSDWSAIIDKTNDAASVSRGYALRVRSTGQPVFTIATTNGVFNRQITNSISDGNWHFIVATYNSLFSTLRIYLDGQIVHSSPTWGTLVQGDDPLFIGRAAYSGSPLFFNGSIDEVQIYDRPLSQAEVAALYPNPSNLLYSAQKPYCAYAGGEVQTLVMPFVYAKSQGKEYYGRAEIRAWYSSTR
ncbi:MAG: LamG domain-containing protein [Candidatus Micrarchaeota archaeon]|nr:LamG domain-containing protein [Candidatus Micrarchaeota archaeon]